MDQDFIELLKVKATSDFLKAKEIEHLLKKIFPNAGLSISVAIENHTLFSTTQNGIKTCFPAFEFINPIKKLKKLHEKEYVVLTHKEYQAITDLLRNYEIIS